MHDTKLNHSTAVSNNAPICIYQYFKTKTETMTLTDKTKTKTKTQMLKSQNQDEGKGQIKHDITVVAWHQFNVM